ncbi:uridine-cytidine kinase-like 1 isoform X2 [Scomber scombrus]|uniref:Uridine-cytidine kinase-like 1 isoform X2 n=1 Tax=Scomber scombrus TaxID=13677 RepID=A0AAV1QF30_SCOSC
METSSDPKAAEPQREEGMEEPDRSMSRSDSGSGDDSLDGLPKHVPRCPLTPSLSPRKRTTSQSKTEPPLLRTDKRTIYTAGRPPWYNVTGTTFKEAFVIGEKHSDL